MEKKLDLIIDKDCPVCKRATNDLLQFSSENGDIQLNISYIGKTEFENILIVPALLINGKLFGYGDVDFLKLNKRLQ